VVIATLNPGKELQQALESVEACPWPNLECLVIDGGSTDGTLERLQAWDDRIAVWVSEPDGGVYEAMNRGVALARGDWILFLGSDDRLCQLDRVAPHLQDEHTVYYGDAWLKKRRRRYDGPFTDYKLAIRNICHQAILYPRWVLQKTPFRRDYPILADHALNIELWARGERFRYLPFIVSTYNDERGLSKVERDPNFERDHANLIKEGFPRWIYFLVWFRNKVRGWLEWLGLRTLVRRLTRKLRGQI
jgi:glycosyltransferase involved in cell wall biosynthesis